MTIFHKAFVLVPNEILISKQDWVPITKASQLSKKLFVYEELFGKQHSTLKGWNGMIFKVPFNPVQTILWFY